MHKSVVFKGWMCLFAGLLGLAVAASPTFAATPLSADINAGANCTSSADLNLSWTGAGTHEEFGVATDRVGSTIGTFGPSPSTNSDWNGLYQVPITTAQPAGSLVGSYAWVGTNPPTPSTAMEFFVVYNCTTKIVLFRCFGAFGSCPKTVSAALATIPQASIPASSAQMLAAMSTLIMLMGAWVLRRRTRTRT